MSCDDCNKKSAGHYCKAGHYRQYQAVIVPQSEEGYSTPEIQSFDPLIARDARHDCGDGRACSWWWITVHPKAFIRRVPGTAIDQPPLSDQIIFTRGMECSSLKVRLTLSDNTNTQRVIIADVGAGIALPWYGPSVKVDVVLSPEDPSGHVVNLVSGRPNYDGVTAQTVEDTVIQANVVALDCCPTDEQLPMFYTDVARLTSPQDFVFSRPAGAKRVAYYTTTGSPDVVAFMAVPGLPVEVATEIARIFPSPTIANPRVGQPFDVPGPACTLALTNAGIGQYTTVWEVQP